MQLVPRDVLGQLQRVVRGRPGRSSQTGGGIEPRLSPRVTTVIVNPSKQSLDFYHFFRR